MPFADPNYFKDEFGVAGKQVLLTFGLLSPNKGIEYALQALPDILREFPNVVYIVLGQTHPNLLRNEGEAYRLSLERLAVDLGVQKHVVFFNRFVELEELMRFIGAADIYLTPYLTEAQITSGTLAYAFGAGNAVVSTPYWHAAELLTAERGKLVPFRDAKAIAVAVVELLRDEPLRHLMRKNAYKLGREMVWSRVAQLYARSFGLTDTSDDAATRAARGILLLAESNFEVGFAPDSQLSQRVLFPSAPSQSHGIEDARFVRFRNDDGSFAYYATYTAYDGKVTLPQLLETPDFLRFKFSTLNGPALQNKGMALFPRKIKGQFVMLSRQDDENILIMFSDNVNFWSQPQVLPSPAQPWEFFKLGNCGSPIETEAGWLVLSHGVGAMRKYCLGAFLLDLNDPTRVIGRLREPLLSPNETEREGYVPNVVYSCGSLLHGRELIIPYAMSDSASSFATVSLDELLAAMT